MIDKACLPCMVVQAFSIPNRCNMLMIDHAGFVNECVQSALETLKHHEAQLKFADEQLAYWKKYREREQNMWNNAYVDYCDWLKKQKESGNESSNN